MANHYTDHLLIHDVRENIALPDIRTDKPGEKTKAGKITVMEHVIYLDEKVIPGSHLYSEAVWYGPGQEAAKILGGEVGMELHSHPFEEVLAFFGGDFKNPRDLGAELEVTLDGEKHRINKTSLIFVPAGMKHSVSFIKIDKRVFHFSIGASNEYKAVAEKLSAKAATGTAKYIVSKLVPPRNEAPWSPPPPPEAANGKGGRILFMDNDIVPGGFYTECVWIAPRSPDAPKPNAEQLAKFKAAVKPHKHNFAEVLCFFGTDPNDVTKLDSDIELWINDEKHIITKSVMVYLPAGTMHCPLGFPRIGMPIIHFTCFPEGKIYYDEVAKAVAKK
jgi:mannose-6-phosphate isomerase-like protein (cupin superfamily)